MKHLILILLVINAWVAAAQLVDNFDDGDFISNPSWQGDTESFIINEDLQLQLNAADAGSSQLFTPINLSDSIRWSAYVKMDFAPSSSNNLRIFLFSNIPSNVSDNALFFEVGETGSTDALLLYERINGNTTLIMSASEGSLGDDPAEFFFVLEKTSDNHWALMVQYKNGPPVLEWEFDYSSEILSSNGFFGFSCEYTSSRIDQFFFDDVQVKDLLPDMEAPEAVAAEILDANKILVQFSEVMDLASLGTIDHYDLLPNIGLPNNVIIDDQNSARCTLVFDQQMIAEQEYVLLISDIMDENGNPMIPKEFTLMTTGPSVVSAIVVNSNQVEVNFSEAMDPNSITEVSNYSINPQLGSPSFVEFNEYDPNKCMLNFNQDLSESEVYTLTLNNIQSAIGFSIAETNLDVVILSMASQGDLVINELLFNPQGDGFDFIEIYNLSKKFIDLASLSIDNIQNTTGPDDLITDRIIGPQEYLAICPNLEWLKENYIIINEEALLENNIPSLNNSSGNASLYSEDESGNIVLIDEVSYNEDWHYALLNSVDGVSLERLSFEGESNDLLNWTSASSTAGYGTPGYKNSQNVALNPGEEVFSIQAKTFSPNGDGDNDQLIMNFSLDKPGYSGTIKIFNARGFLIRELYDNIFLPQTGFLTWDGSKSDFQKASVGIYIMAYQFFHPDGDVVSGKRPCVLAEFLD